MSIDEPSASPVHVRWDDGSEGVVALDEISRVQWACEAVGVNDPLLLGHARGVRVSIDKQPNRDLWPRLLGAAVDELERRRCEPDLARLVQVEVGGPLD